MTIDLKAEAARLRRVMDRQGCVNLFVSEGAGVESIVREMEAAGEAVPRDAFGHVKLDAVNPGAWFGKQFAAMIGAEKTLVQKSGYFARSAPANAEDLRLIRRCADLAVQCALDGGPAWSARTRSAATSCAPSNSNGSREGKPSVWTRTGSSRRSVRLGRRAKDVRRET